MQYYSYPDDPFDVLRETEPGRFEAGADIALGRWTRFRIETNGAEFAAYADGKLILSGHAKIPARQGRIGPWVDIGTERFFANLVVS